MRFTAEGTYKVTIIEAACVQPKLAPPDMFDVALRVRDEDGHEDIWRGPVSHNYGKGNFADRTQEQITAEDLAKIGYKHGNDFCKVGELVGTETEATVKSSVSPKDGKTYYNVRYLGGGGVETVTPLSPDEIQRRMAALLGTPAPASPTAPAPAPAANPFANKTNAANPFAK